MTEEEIEVHYKEFLKLLGNRIRKFRKDRNLSLHDMVAKHGYRDSQWRRFERGGAANMLSLLKIASAFETSLSDLLDGLGKFPATSLSEVEKQETATKSVSSRTPTKRK